MSDNPYGPFDPGFGWCPPGKRFSTHLFHFPTERIFPHSQPLFYCVSQDASGSTGSTSGRVLLKCWANVDDSVERV
ncbi:MAG: hypothetical protein VXW44_06440, partial [SAR324 cluster bacterium]|nr:hypothetical protein [SAR324 cluster bacterium]